jgi:Protein of unknown function (DUF2505)
MKFAVEIAARGIDFPSFRRVYYSEEFNQEVAEAVKLKERSQQEFVVLPDGKERRRVHVVPNVNLPGVILKLLDGKPISYDEITVFDPASRSASFEVESIATDTISVTGLVRFVEEGGNVKVIFDGEAKVKVFGVGGMIERYIVGEVKGRYEHVQRLLQQFIDQGRVQKTTPLSQRPAT